MSACFIVRAQVADAAVKKEFDRAWGDKVVRSRDVVQVVQRIGR